MKKLLFIIAMLISASCFAQDSIQVKRTEEYAEMVATQKLFSSKVTIAIDYGEHKWDKRVKSDDGKVTTFNSAIDGMNYMNSQGWEFVNAFPISVPNSGSVYHFYFKRRIN